MAIFRTWHVVLLAELPILLFSIRSQPARGQALEQYSLIAYTSEVNRFWDLFVVNPDGSNPINITNTPTEMETDPAWSPDGTRIAYQAFPDDVPSEIFVFDGISEPVNLTNNTRYVDFMHSWSPDGTQIVFASNRTGNYDIFVMDADDGGNVVNLTNHPDYDSHPAWSPDGRQIVFSSDRGIFGDIFVMNADGTNVVELTDDEPYHEHFDWSPDGNWLVFTQSEGETVGDLVLYLYNFGEASRTQLTDWGAPPEAHPSWSPDGRQIVYSATMTPTATQDMFILDVENPTVSLRLTDTDIVERAPDWSPWLEGLDFYTAFVRNPTVMTCPEAPPSRLNVGMSAYVAVPVQEGDERADLRVRAAPGGEQIGSMPPGTPFQIIGNPVCGDDGLMWWPITTLDGTLSGWSAEGAAPDDYFMVPYAGG